MNKRATARRAEQERLQTMFPEYMVEEKYRRRLPPRLPKKHEYCLAVTEWARHFKVPVPTVRMRAERTNTDYIYYRNWQRLRPWIAMASSGIHAGRDALIHEFAHHLDYQNRKYDIGHDRVFFTVLVQVATFVLGRPEDYDWTREYRTIHRWAIEQGLAAPVPALVHARTTLEQRQAARARFLDDHYRDYQTVLEQSATDGSIVYIFTKPELAPKCFLLAFTHTMARPSKHYEFKTLGAAKREAQDFLKTVLDAWGKRRLRQLVRKRLTADDKVPWDQAIADLVQETVDGRGLNSAPRRATVAPAP